MSDNRGEREAFLNWLEAKLKKEGIACLKAAHSQTGRLVDRFEIDAGEPTDGFAARVWEDLEADANAFEGRQVYYLALFREGAAEAEATRPVRIVPGDESAENFDTPHTMLAQAFRHNDAMARVVERMSVAALDRADAQNDRLLERDARRAEQEYEVIARLRQAALDQGEIEIRKEQAKMEAAIITKAMEQLELIAPIIVSRFMKKDESPGGEVERRLLKNFLDTLKPEQQFQILGCLDSVQQIAVQSLMQGEIDPMLEAVAIRKIMAGITEEQLRGIANILEDDKQRQAFERVYNQRQHSLKYAAEKALMPVPQAGTNGASS
jgi:hypothetical protein